MRKIDLIKNFVKEINENFTVIESNYWSSHWQEEIVYVYLDNEEIEGDKEFLNFIEKTYKIKEPNNFIFSLLHEIGHLETETQELSDQRAILLETYEWQFENEMITREQYFEKYFQIPAERIATDWAIAYYLVNEEKIKKLLTLIK